MGQLNRYHLGACQKCKNLRFHSGLLHSNLHFNKAPGGFYACYKFERDLSGALFIGAEKYPYVFS